MRPGGSAANAMPVWSPMQMRYRSAHLQRFAVDDTLARVAAGGGDPDLRVVRWKCGVILTKTIYFDAKLSRARCPDLVEGDDWLKVTAANLHDAATHMSRSYHCPCPSGLHGRGYWLGVEIEVPNVDKYGNYSDAPPLPIPSNGPGWDQNSDLIDPTRVWLECSPGFLSERSAAATLPNGCIVAAGRAGGYGPPSAVTLAHEFAHILGLDSEDHDESGWFGPHDKRVIEAVSQVRLDASKTCKILSKYLDMRGDDGCCYARGGTTSTGAVGGGLLVPPSSGGYRQGKLIGIPVEVRVGEFVRDVLGR